MLNLLSKNQIVGFINRLMNKGFYDGLMLQILDDDPIYPTSGFQEIYQHIAQNLSLPFPTVEQAKWIITLEALSPYLATPYHYDIFQLDEYYSIYQKFEIYFDNWQTIYQDIDGFKNILYKIDDALPDFINNAYYQGYSDPKTIYGLETEFFLMVNNWFTHNSSLLEKIFTELLDKT